MSLLAPRKRPTCPVEDDDRTRRSLKRRKTAKDGMTATFKGQATMPPPLAPSTTPLSSSQQEPAIKQDVLTQYYPYVETLRSYLLTRLPESSRIRRKRLASVGKTIPKTAGGNTTKPPSAVEELLSRILNTTLVARADNANKSRDQRSPDYRQQLRETFSQTRQADESNVTISNAANGASSPQAEIVDFVVWHLFKRAKQGGTFDRFDPYPKNVLCHGFQRSRPSSDHMPCTIPGLYAARPPQSSQALKEAPWPQLLALLGVSGEKIMTDLLLDCSLFLAVDSGDGNYIQVTGKPLFDVLSTDLRVKDKQQGTTLSTGRQLSDMTLVRSRMFYTKAHTTRAGSVRFGLRNNHVLNRFPYLSQLPQNAPRRQTLELINKIGTAHTAMYMFPRQFGLHNAFTSIVDRQKTTQKFQDYTVREAEIVEKFGSPKQRSSESKVPIPKRLRGMPMALVEKMRQLHSKCSYYALIEHYCPASRQSSSQDEAGTNDAPIPLVQLATPLAQVSAFCQAVFRKVVPDDFWGSGDVRNHNKAAVLKKVDSFIRLLRYETQSLHGLLQDLKIAEIAWLAPPGLQGSKMSKTDLQKRQEIFAELLYYLFDSFLMPLIHCNFYVTESNAHRNRLFYFRHDVWQRISEPAMESIKASRFEEVNPSDAAQIVQSRDLGYGHLRLLPKSGSVRPIMNLRRRASKIGDTRLASSINTVLSPVAAMLNLEMKQHPERLGASMLSIHGMYDRLKQFGQQFENKKRPAVFYFAKVDVKSAYDTIPQDAMVALLGSVPSHPVYHIDKYIEISKVEKEVRSTKSHTTPKSRLGPERNWHSVAKAVDDTSGFHDSVENTLAQYKRNTIFVDSAFRKARDAESLAVLAASHIKQNIVKIGKEYYRQKTGIPQGSILSSILCSYFYADLEDKKLSFLRDKTSATGGDEGVDDSLLLRLIDDFLLITTDRSKAVQFVEVMQRGHPEFGVEVNPKKSLVNFDMKANGQPVPRVAPGAPFPYCGTYINCSTLNVTKDRETKQNVVFDGLTVERSRSPGYQFKRKIFSYFQIQSHQMFFDTSYNSRRTTLRNLHGTFAETASKLWAYARCMPKAQRPNTLLIISTIEELSSRAFGILKGKSRLLRSPDYRFAVPRPHFEYILLHAFLKVLQTKQTGYKEVLAWLRQKIRQLREQRHLRLPKEFMDD